LSYHWQIGNQQNIHTFLSEVTVHFKGNKMEKAPSSVTVLFPFRNKGCKKLVGIESNEQAY